jgi:hypothetical protein
MRIPRTRYVDASTPCCVCASSSVLRHRGIRGGTFSILPASPHTCQCGCGCRTTLSQAGEEELALRHDSSWFATDAHLYLSRTLYLDQATTERPEDKATESTVFDDWNKLRDWLREGRL